MIEKNILYHGIVKLTQYLIIWLLVDNFVGKLIKWLTNPLWHIDGNNSKINATALEVGSSG